VFAVKVGPKESAAKWQAAALGLSAAREAEYPFHECDIADSSRGSLRPRPTRTGPTTHSGKLSTRTGYAALATIWSSHFWTPFRLIAEL